MTGALTLYFSNVSCTAAMSLSGSRFNFIPVLGLPPTCFTQTSNGIVIALLAWLSWSPSGTTPCWRETFWRSVSIMSYSPESRALSLKRQLQQKSSACCQLKSFRCLYDKHSKHRSDSSCKSCQIWVHTVCLHTYMYH